jgi:hypothetical protein
MTSHATVGQLQANLARLMAARHIAANMHRPRIQELAARDAEDLADEAESHRRAAAHDMHDPSMGDAAAIEQAESDRMQNEAIAYGEQ